MVFGDKSIDKQPHVAGEVIDNVEKFECLGSIITWDNNYSIHIKHRISNPVPALPFLRHIEQQKNQKQRTR